MYNAMKKLIEKRFYKTKDEILNKLDVFYACNRITDDEYTELIALSAAYYD